MSEITSRLREDWAVVERLLPEGWQAQARTLGAFRRARGIADAATLLRLMFIHLADGCGLRETAVRAREGRLAEISDVALMNRLRGCGAWFRWMGAQLRQRTAERCPAAPALPRPLRVVDGSVVAEPGATGTRWRLHYSIDLATLACEEVRISGPEEGETLKRFTIRPGEVLLADRGFAHAAGIAHVLDGRADVIVRTNLVTLPLLIPGGERLDVLKRLRRLRCGQAGDWPVEVRHGQRRMAGRLCAVRKSAVAAEQALARVRRESQRNGSQIRPETEAASAYVLIFTTLAADTPATTVLEVYRARWQIEISFKRLKSLLQLGHLKKTDARSAQAWLQGKLPVSFLIEALIAHAERFSPWGYPLSVPQDGTA